MKIQLDFDKIFVDRKRRNASSLSNENNALKVNVRSYFNLKELNGAKRK